VASLLHLAGPIASEDASDALAIAICHATHAFMPVAFVEQKRAATPSLRRSEARA
jgi:Holliday junction resolvasome RuvABC endonuclease subunit